VSQTVSNETVPGALAQAYDIVQRQENFSPHCRTERPVCCERVRAVTGAIGVSSHQPAAHERQHAQAEAHERQHAQAEALEAESRPSAALSFSLLFLPGLPRHTFG